MRYQHPKIGDRRITKAFLFFPLKIGTESRWLETATYEEEYRVTNKVDFGDEGWVPLRWINSSLY